MVGPAPGGYIIKDAKVTFGPVGGPEVDYTNQFDTATLTPTQATQTRRMLTPDGTLQDVDTATWSLSLAGVQDYVDARGFARYLFEHQGQKADFTLEPRAGEEGMTGTVTIKAVPFGGETGGWAEFSVELPVDGQPELVDPA
jgi:Phage tail tube protein